MDARDPLTDKQAAVLEFIRKCIDADGVCPSVREIATRFGWVSTHNVALHLFRLEKKGYIRRGGARNHARSYTIIGESPAELRAEIARLRAIIATRNAG